MISSDNLSLGDRPNLDLYKPFHSPHRSKIEEHNIFRQAFKGESIEEYTQRRKQLKDEILRIGPDKVGDLLERL